MKIIKRGTKLDQVYGGTCSACGAEFEESVVNLKVEPGGQMDGPFASVKCPQCGVPAYMYPKRETRVPFPRD